MNPTVYDCGGRGGLHRSWRAFPFKLNYVAFEPDAEEAQRMMNDPNQKHEDFTYHVVPKAVSNDTRNRNLNLYRQRDLSSFYELNLEATYRYKTIPLDQEIEMACTNVDSASIELGLTPDFLNIDVQGATLDVLLGAEATFEHILGVRCETELIPLYKEAPRLDAVLRHFWSAGWKLIRMETCGDGSFGLSTDMNKFSIGAHDSIPAFCDSIFINDPYLDRLLASHAPEDRQKVLWAVAYLLHNGAGFYAMEILERLDNKLDFAALFSGLPAPSIQSLSAALAVYLSAARTNINAGKSFATQISMLEALSAKGPLAPGQLDPARKKIREIYRIQ